MRGVPSQQTHYLHFAIAGDIETDTNANQVLGARVVLATDILVLLLYQIAWAADDGVHLQSNPHVCKAIHT